MPFRHKTNIRSSALPIRTLSHTAATSMLNIYTMDRQWTSSSDLFIRNMLSGNKHAFWKEPAITQPKSSALYRPRSPVPRRPTGREKGPTPTHTPNGSETTLQASCSVEVSGFIETLRWGPCTHMTQVLWPVSPIAWAPSNSNGKHTSNYFKLQTI